MTTPLDKDDNVATLHLAPGYDKFMAYCAEVGASLGTDDNPVVMPTVIPDDSDEDSVVQDYSWRSNRARSTARQTSQREYDDMPITTDFSLNGPPTKARMLPQVVRD